MRITAGRHKGRKLAVPPGRDIRPTSDKIRQAVFNILFGYDLPVGVVVLDGFCGSGALGLEALSRGAASCIFIDRNTQTASRNAHVMEDGHRVTFLTRDIQKIGRRTDGVSPAQLVFLDPPYGRDFLPPSLRALESGGWLAPGALCVLECEKTAEPPLPDVFQTEDIRIYGATKIILCRYRSAPAEESPE